MALPAMELDQAASSPRLVVRGMTAMKGTPISLAKYASETAVEPLDASITGLPGRIQPLHRP